MSTTYTGTEKDKNIAGGPEMVKLISYWISTGQKMRYCIGSKSSHLKKQSHKDYEK